MDQLGATWPRVELVVLGAVVMHLVLIGSVRLLGQRTVASMSSFDLRIAIAPGAVVGRTSLLLDPTLLVGLFAMGTLFAIQITLVRLRRWRGSTGC